MERANQIGEIVMKTVVRVMPWVAFSLVVGAVAVGGEGRVSQDSDEMPVGEYEFTDGTWFSLMKTGNTAETVKPYFMDGQSCRIESLISDGPDRFRATGNGKPSDANQTTIVVQRDASGAVSSLEITEAGEQTRTATPVPGYRSRDITFANDGVTLSGTLRIPPGSGPFPAIVLIHGSGPGVREQLAPMSSFFSRLGLATLTYDKRGCGGSKGDWRQVDLDVLADDALAGVHFLQSLPEIDAKRVGLYGISQGGWIGPLAASRDEHVAFVINQSGPLTSLREQDTHMTQALLLAGGLTDSEVNTAIRGLNTLYDFGCGKASGDAVRAVIAEFQKNPQLTDLLPTSVDDITPAKLYQTQEFGDPAWFFHLNPDNDALMPYRKLRCPVLILYGKHDFTIPVERSIELVGELVRERGDTDFVVHVLPENGHGVLRINVEKPMQPAEPYRFDRSFFEFPATWLREHGFTSH